MDERERIYKFSSPKILRLIEIIRQFKPKMYPTEESQPCIEESNSKNSSGIQLNSDTIETVNVVVENGNSAPKLHHQTKSNSSQLKSDICKIKKDVYSVSNCVDSGSTQWIACMNGDNINDVSFKQENGELSAHRRVENECMCEVNNESLSNNCIKNEVHIESFELNKINKLNDIKSGIDVDNSIKIHINGHNGTISEDEHSESNSVHNLAVGNLIVTKDNYVHVTALLENIVNENSNLHNRISHINIEESKEIVVRSITNEESNERSGRWRGRGKSWRFQRRNQNQQFNNRINKSNFQDDAESLCGIIFVESRFTAKILFHLLNVSINITCYFSSSL